MSITTADYTRNVSRVKKALKEHSDGTVVALEPLSLFVPFRFIDKNLLQVKDTVKVLGCYGIVVAEKYFASDNTTCLFETEPSRVNDVVMDDEAYVELVYEPGDKILAQPAMLADKDLVYVVGQEIINNGKVPWYFTFWDIVTLNLNFEQQNGMRLLTDMAIYELFVSLMQRNPKDLTKPYRVGLKSNLDFVNNPPVLVGINKVDVIVSGTLAKLGGPYLSASITGALNSEPTNISQMEYLLRA